jgi:predicted permease
VDDGTDSGGTGAALITSVTPDYFQTLGIRLLRGRAFLESDDGGDGVAIINAVAAERYWPGVDPIGRRVGCGDGPDAPKCTIVGVVANVKAGAQDTPDQPHIYRSAYQSSWLGLAFFVRGGASVPSLAEPLRREVHAADRDLPVFQVFTMDQLMTRSLAGRRFMAGIVGMFAVVSVVLAGVGIYGVIALTVSQRTAEFGVRLALGAGRGQIASMVVRHGLKIASAGIGVGGLGGIAATLAMRGMLFQTHPLDPVTWMAIVAVLFAVAALACWIPARRASMADPMIALRGE